MNTARLLLIIGILLPAFAAAETVYVTDQWSIALRADATPGASAVKMLSTGTPLEVLERGAGLVRVRDPQGAEGWIETSALSAQAPAAAQVRGLRAELERTRTQLVQTQAQLDQARAAAPAAGTEQLRTELQTVRQQVALLQGELKKKEEELASLAANPAAPVPVATAPADTAPATAPEGGFSFLWAGIAFAMLVLGFIGGVVWVREGIRRRMGGLYLRI